MTATLSRRTALGLIATAVTLPKMAWAKEPNVFQPDGPAIHGTDPVAYFTQGKPVKGSADHSVSYDGATWHFASAENAALFEANPARYAPQYGGYCAYAASRGYIATTVPEAWSIHDDKLYLNYSRSVRALWAAQKRSNIRKADENWPGILG